MQAAVTAARDLLAPRLHGAAHALLIPVREREADVIDHGARCRAIAWRCIAGDDEGATLAGRRAEHQVRALAGVLAGRVLEPEYVDIEVARLGVVRARIGQMIDAKHLEAGAGLGVGGISRRVDRGGERDGLTELAAVDGAAFELFDEIGDETFHGISSLDRAFWR